ncbi:putative alcohol dehydrogenase class-3-like isoform 1 [Capsicum annuum]|nr:putative alcohol dehydrogenase class-3-like isoform 1 [Capsicum annuum]
MRLTKFYGSYSDTKDAIFTFHVKRNPPTVSSLMLNYDAMLCSHKHIDGLGGVFRNSVGDWIVGFIVFTVPLDPMKFELLTLFKGLQLAMELHLHPLKINVNAQLLELLTDINANSFSLLSDCSESSLSSSSSASNQTGPGPLPSWVDGPAKSPRTIGSTSSTAQVHPQLFTKTLLSKAVNEYGVEVVIGKAERVELAEGKTRGVVLEDGREIAHSIVLKPKEPDRITPHALFLTYYPAQGGKPMDPEVYPRPTGEVYICGMSARAEVPDDPEQITPVPESINTLKRVAASVSSHLVEGEAAVKTEQACILPCSEDDVPIIGEVPGIKGCYVATGHSCWGILNGPATGAAMAELILDGHASIVDLSRFNPTRFSSARKNVGPSCDRRNQQAVVPLQENGNLVATRIRNFVRMNPPEFYGSKVNEDPQLFIDEVRKMTQIMYVTEEESVELASCRLKDVAYDWVMMWKDDRGENAAPECRTTMLIGDMDIARLMTHAQHIKAKKLKKRKKRNKRARTGQLEFSQPRSGGGNRSLFQGHSSVPGHLQPESGRNSGAGL